MTYSEPMFRGDDDPWTVRIPNGIPFGFFAPPTRRSAVVGMQGQFGPQGVSEVHKEPTFYPRSTAINLDMLLLQKSLCFRFFFKKQLVF